MQKFVTLVLLLAGASTIIVAPYALVVVVLAMVLLLFATGTVAFRHWHCCFWCWHCCFLVLVLLLFDDGAIIRKTNSSF